MIFFSFSISFKFSRFLGCANPQRSSWSQYRVDPFATEAKRPDWNLISNCGLLTAHTYLREMLASWADSSAASSSRRVPTTSQRCPQCDEDSKSSLLQLACSNLIRRDVDELLHSLAPIDALSFPSTTVLPSVVNFPWSREDTSPDFPEILFEEIPPSSPSPKLTSLIFAELN